MDEDDANSTPGSSPGGGPPPATSSNRVYDAEAVDEYVAQLHSHADALQLRIQELEALVPQGSSWSPASAGPVSSFAAGNVEEDELLVAARRDAAELLETARLHAAEVLAEGERLAAQAVIRALEHIDAVVRGWEESGAVPPTAAVIDLRDGVAHRRR